MYPSMQRDILSTEIDMAAFCEYVHYSQVWTNCYVTILWNKTQVIVMDNTIKLFDRLTSLSTIGDPLHPMSKSTAFLGVPRGNVQDAPKTIVDLEHSSSLQPLYVD